MATNSNVPQLLNLHSLDDALKFCERICKTEFVPQAYRNKPNEALAAVQYGAEIGLSPMQALQSLAPINGRPTLWGDAMPALCYGSGLVEYIEESDDGTTATCKVKRKGDPKVRIATFSNEDAKRAGLLGKQGPWTQYTARMRQMRARSFALRDKFPDVLKGVIAREEAMDYPSVETTATEVPDNPPPGEMKVSETLTLVVEGQPRKATTQGNGSTPPADPAVDPLITDQQQIRLLAVAKKAGWNMQQIGQSLSDAFGIPDLSELRASQVAEFEAMIGG